ncbi:MAG: hypothetical protein V4448_16640 [Pseudomonadota bacterium]
MKYLVSAALTAAILAGCAVAPTYRGQVVQQVPFKIDDGTSLSLPMVRGGALPAENDEYKIDGAGYMGSLKAGSASQSEIQQTFSIVVKKNAELEYVRIEQVDTDGGLQLVVQDNQPVLKNKNWVGKTKPVPATRDASPWLYSSGNSTFLFKFTIKAKGSAAIVMYQPSLFNRETKAVYLRVIQGPAS